MVSDESRKELKLKLNLNRQYAPGYISAGNTSLYVSPENEIFVDAGKNAEFLKLIENGQQLTEIKSISPIETGESICFIVEKGGIHHALPLAKWFYSAGRAITILYSTDYKDDFLFLDELSAMQMKKGIDVNLAIKEDQQDWTGPVGNTEYLLNRTAPHDTYILFTTIERADQLSMQLENDKILFNAIDLIDCGQGYCNRCYLFGKKVCKEGPIVKYGVR